MKIESDKPEDFMPYLEEFLSSYPRDKPIRWPTIGDATCLLVPEVPTKYVRKIVRMTLYVIYYMVYFKKLTVALPSIGKFYAVFRPRREYNIISPITKEPMRTLIRSKWSFRFKTSLMNYDTYKKFIEKHKAAAAELGYVHDDLRVGVAEAWRKQFCSNSRDVITPVELYYDRYLLVKYWMPFKTGVRNRLLQYADMTDETAAIQTWEDMRKENLHLLSDEDVEYVKTEVKPRTEAFEERKRARAIDRENRKKLLSQRGDIPNAP